MTPAFVAAVLEGFEGTLDVVLGRLNEGELKREVESLRTHIAKAPSDRADRRLDREHIALVGSPRCKVAPALLGAKYEQAFNAATDRVPTRPVAFRQGDERYEWS